MAVPAAWAKVSPTAGARWYSQQVGYMNAQSPNLFGEAGALALRSCHLLSILQESLQPHIVPRRVGCARMIAWQDGWLVV